MLCKVGELPIEMAGGRGKRSGAQGKVDDNLDSRNQSGEQAGVVGNATLELLLQKMNEFQEKLEQLSSSGSEGRRETASTSSRETAGEASVVSTGGGSQGTTVSTLEVGNATSSTTQNIYVIQPTVSKPTFDGKSLTNPIAFLKRLKKYIKSLNAHDREVDIALECVTGHARKVMELCSKDWVTFADFETDFRRNYWTEQIQESVRYKLINAVYSDDTGITLTEHFAEQVESMQSLTIAFSDRDLVNSIMRHYPIDIQQLWFTKTEEPTIMNGAKFLRSIEQNIVTRRRMNVSNNANRISSRDKYNRRPITATMSAGVWQNRRGSPRGWGHRRGRGGYSSNYNRTAPPTVRRDGPSPARRAITFVKEVETPSTSKSVEEDKQKN